MTKPLISRWSPIERARRRFDSAANCSQMQSLVEVLSHSGVVASAWSLRAVPLLCIIDGRLLFR